MAGEERACAARLEDDIGVRDAHAAGSPAHGSVGRFPAGGLEFGQVGQGAVELGLQVADPQDAADPAEQLDLVDGLGEKVVGARLNAALEVGRFVERGDHEDEQVFGLGIGADLLADLEARQPGHHHIEQEQVGLEFLDDLQGLFAVVGGADLAVEIAEIGLQQLDVLKVVVGDQDFGGAAEMIQFRSPPGTGRACPDRGPASRVAGRR